MLPVPLALTGLSRSDDPDVYALDATSLTGDETLQLRSEHELFELSFADYCVNEFCVDVVDVLFHLEFDDKEHDVELDFVNEFHQLERDGGDHNFYFELLEYEWVHQFGEHE